jgi:hypothetical protein
MHGQQNIKNVSVLLTCYFWQNKKEIKKERKKRQRIRTINFVFLNKNLDAIFNVFVLFLWFSDKPCF